jgi:chromosome segregation ATPase
MDYTAIIIAVIASIPGIFAIISQVRRDRNDVRKIDVDAIDVAQKSVSVLLEPLNRRIEELEKIGESCKARITAFEKAVGEKNERISELEQIIANKDARIAGMQREIDELRTRVAQLEKNGNGGSYD